MAVLEIILAVCAVALFTAAYINTRLDRKYGRPVPPPKPGRRQQPEHKTLVPLPPDYPRS